MLITVEIPLLKKCFCCVPLRQGLIIWGFLEMLFMLTAAGVLLSPFFTEDMYDVTIIRMSIAWCIIDIGFSLTLIIAVWKRLYKLLQVYYYYAICNSFMALLMSLLTLYFGIVVVFFAPNMSKVLQYFLNVCTIPLLTVLLQIYLVLLVRSKLIVLQKARQFRYLNNGDEELLITEDPNENEKQLNSTHRAIDIILKA